MPGKLISVVVSQIIGYKSNWPVVPSKTECFIREDAAVWTKRRPWHVYVAIFGPTQQEQLNVLKNWKRANILYISKPAVNKNHGHGFLPRNTLVIFELKNEKKLQDGAVPQVPKKRARQPRGQSGNLAG